jgi:protein TonB
MSLVAAIHAAVLLAIMRSLGVGAPVKVPDPMITELYKQERPPEEIPPPREPDLRPSQDTQVLPRPDLQNMEFEQETLVLPDYVEEPPPTGSAVPQPQIVGVRLDPHNPLTQPPYPPGMVRQGNQGTVDIEVYVLPNGRVGDARVVRSTGWDELDRSAIAEAKRYWRLLPATRDGEPIAQWHKLRVTFKLKDNN